MCSKWKKITRVPASWRKREHGAGGGMFRQGSDERFAPEIGVGAFFVRRIGRYDNTGTQRGVGGRWLLLLLRSLLLQCRRAFVMELLEELRIVTQQANRSRRGGELLMLARFLVRQTHRARVRAGRDDSRQQNILQQSLAVALSRASSLVSTTLHIYGTNKQSRRCCTFLTQQPRWNDEEGPLGKTTRAGASTQTPQ